jgi:hypothetical protein
MALVNYAARHSSRDSSVVPLQSTEDMIESQTAFTGRPDTGALRAPLPPRPWVCIGGLLPALLGPCENAKEAAPPCCRRPPGSAEEIEEGEVWFVVRADVVVLLLFWCWCCSGQAVMWASWSEKTQTTRAATLW